jgi:hypothetical protein
VDSERVRAEYWLVSRVTEPTEEQFLDLAPLVSRDYLPVVGA